MVTHNRNETVSRVVVFSQICLVSSVYHFVISLIKLTRGTETINIFTNTIYFYKNLSMCLGLAILHEHLCYSAGKFY